MRRMVQRLFMIAALAGAVPPAAGAQGRPAAPRFVNPPSMPPVRGYSQVVEVPPGQRLLFIAGQVALDSTGTLVGLGDFRAQARQVFENLRHALTAQGRPSPTSSSSTSTCSTWPTLPCCARCATST
jgi:enamine deaminase RidA (YjgF/YER057c/UK114 family)